MTNNKGSISDGVVREGSLTGAASDLIEVAAGLVFRDGLLLISQRRPQDHLGGLWEFPGGKREPGESPEDCLRRELMEELGIEVEIKELVETIAHDYPSALADQEVLSIAVKEKRVLITNDRDYGELIFRQL